MKKIMDRLIILTLLGVAIVVGLSQWGLPEFSPPTAPKVDTVWTRVLQQSEAVAETTRVVVTQWKTRVDSMPGDTVWMPRTVVESVFVACSRCATQLDSTAAYADSALRAKDDTIMARDDSIYRLNRALASCKGSRPWWAVAGGAVSLLACRG